MTLDWTEKKLEDYTWEHWYSVRDAVYRYGSPAIRRLGRQVPCQYGIIDTLVAMGSDLWVVEFKAEKARQTVLGQLQRYRAAIRNTDAYRFLMTAEELSLFSNVVEVVYEPQLVVIAPDFSRDVVMGADLCIRATMDSGMFLYELVDNPARRMNGNGELEAALSTYLEDMVEAQKQRMRESNDEILVRSAEQRLKYGN
jgi:hypothetical protein